MPAFLFGLPSHPLVVHAVVVLVPLAVLGCAVAAAWPSVRRRIGWPVVALTAVAVACIPIATGTGEDLERNLPRTAALQTHTQLGDELLVWVAAMLVGILALVLLDRARRQQAATASGQAEGPGAARSTTTTVTPPSTGMRVATIALSVATLALAVVSAVQVVRIGDTGARAAWGAIQYVQQAPPQRPGG
jgi:hypothetical protein